MHPYGCVVFIFCNLLKYYFFDKGVCFSFPLLLAVPHTHPYVNVFVYLFIAILWINSL